MAHVKNVLKDPVCGMDVEPQSKTPFAMHGGRKYYFCAEACRRAFEKTPGKFLKAVKPQVEEEGPVEKTVTTDPVCNMRVYRTRENLACNYQGTRYYFCGNNCMRAFAEDPDRYLKKKGIVSRFLDRLARANEREFGSGGPSCH